MSERSDVTMYRFYLETGTPEILGGALLVDDNPYTDMHTSFETAKKPSDEFNWNPNSGETHEF
jgi:hypothetical protein